MTQQNKDTITALIWRYQLFKPSEHFIVNQALGLHNFVPLLLGGQVMSEPQYEIPYKNLDCSLQDKLAMAMNRPGNKLASAIEQIRPDLIHAHFCIDASMLLPVLRNDKTKLIVTCHGFDATITRWNMLKSMKPAWLWHALHEKELMKRADMFICVSEFIKNKMLEKGYSEEKLITHYIGIDIDAVKPDRNIVKTADPRLLTVGRLTEKKGIRYLISAFAQVIRNVPDARLDIVGDGPLRSTLEQQVREHGLEQSVAFLGECDHATVLGLMQKAWAFCLPSVTAANGDAEGLGMVFLEAQALKLPVVATQSGGIPEAVSDGNTGFLVHEKDSAVLAERIINLLTDDELRRTIGTKARAFIEKNFSMSRQAVMLEEIYKDVLK